MDAFIIVDMQNDFLPGGALAVPEGDAIIPLLNQLQEKFDLVVLTQDWHPPDHSSFASRHPGKKPLETIELHGSQQILWPDHCVQDSRGAELAAALETRRAEAFFRKGTDPKIDSYSAFYDNEHQRSTGLAGYLNERGVRRVAVGGLAAEFCVNYTALDARKAGFETVLLTDATKPISSQDFEFAAGNLRNYGVNVVESTDYFQHR